MGKQKTEFKLGLSEYALNAYIALSANHPVNGSQLSRQSGIPRARIYDVLETLIEKGFIIESSKGMYTPIPNAEFLRQLRQEFERQLAAIEKRLKKAQQQPENDVIWTIKGYEAAMGKARDMIQRAETEIYVRISPQEGRHLDDGLLAAQERGVAVKYISMEPRKRKFQYQIIHPGSDPVSTDPNTRFFDIVKDKDEILCGMFVDGDDESSVINWGLNKRFVLSGRDSLRHDFFHYFLHKTQNLGQPLSEEEQALYDYIQKDI